MNTYQSKIATIVYKQKGNTENVDMNNPLFKQSELDNLIKTDKDIVRVDYYIGGVLVSNKVYTPKQAASQIIKLNNSISKITNEMEGEYGHGWYAFKLRNETRDKNIGKLENKIENYRKFLTKEVYEDMLECDMCCTWNDYMG